MNLHSLYIAAIAAGAGAAFAPLTLNGADTVAEARGFSSDVILSTDAYRWQGDKIETKQTLGTIYSDPEQDNKTELYFQIYQDRNILNPASWICQ